MKNTVIDLESIKNKLAKINAEVEQLPAGRLAKNGKFYLHVIDNQRIGISNNKKLIRQLSRKKYLLTWKNQLTNNLKLATDYNKKIDKKKKKKKMLENLTTTYSQLPTHYFYHSEVDEFLTKAYPKNIYPDQKNYQSNNGTTVRSKSEVLIANILEDHNIPYRYEIPLKMGTHQKYPDFTIMHPFTGEIIIWEHFGALNQPGYEEKMNEKMRLYLKNNYLPFKNLIYTFEFDLSPKRLKNIIEEIILKH